MKLNKEYGAVCYLFASLKLALPTHRQLTFNHLINGSFYSLPTSRSDKRCHFDYAFATRSNRSLHARKFLLYALRDAFPRARNILADAISFSAKKLIIVRRTIITGMDTFYSSYV